MKQITVRSKSMKSEKIKITARIIGFITLKFKAEGTTAGDAVEQKLRIVPEGVARAINDASFIDLIGVTKEDERNLECILPPNAGEYFS